MKRSTRILSICLAGVGLLGLAAGAQAGDRRHAERDVYFSLSFGTPVYHYGYVERPRPQYHHHYHVYQHRPYHRPHYRPHHRPHGHAHGWHQRPPQRPYGHHGGHHRRDSKVERLAKDRRD